MVAVCEEVAGGLDLLAGHELVAVRITEGQFSRCADQIEHGLRIGDVRDFHADAGAVIDLLHRAFRISLVGQTLLNHGDGAVHQSIKAALDFIGLLGGILNIHAAAQIQAQGQGFRPVFSIGGGHPGEQSVQAAAVKRHAVEAEIAKDDGQHQQHAQADNRAGFSVGALFLAHVQSSSI